MGEPARRPHYTTEEYVQLERLSNVRHEYVDGEIYAMAGGSPAHNRICATLIRLIGNELQGRPCTVFTSDQRVLVEATGLVTYPDVTVVCGRIEVATNDNQAIVNPALMVEVTSPRTEAYDRGDKLVNYRRIPSLREIAIVSHSARRVELWRRSEDGSWLSVIIEASDAVRLESVDSELSLAAIYRDPLEPTATLPK